MRPRFVVLVLLSAALLGGCAGSCGGGYARVSSDGVISRSAASEAEVEPSVAVGTTGSVAAAWMNVASGKPTVIGYAFGRGGGVEWTRPRSIASPAGRFAADPTLVDDGAGGFYLAWLGFRPDVVPLDVRVFVAHAAPDARAFDAPAVANALESVADRPRIVRAGQSRLVVAYAFTRGDHGGVAAARSDDGREWKERAIVDEPGLSGFLPYACARGARVVVAYFDPRGRVGVHASGDGGETWVDYGAVDAPSSKVAAEAPACAFVGDVAWVAFGASDDPASTGASAKVDAIAIAPLDPAQRRIGPGTVYRDRSAKLLMHPTLAADGALELAYYADDGTFRATWAQGGSATFVPSFVLGPSRFEPSRTSRAWAGDYAGLAASGDATFAVFGDGSSGASHVVFRRGPPRVQ